MARAPEGDETEFAKSFPRTPMHEKPSFFSWQSLVQASVRGSFRIIQHTKWNIWEPGKEVKVGVRWEIVWNSFLEQQASKAGWSLMKIPD